MVKGMDGQIVPLQNLKKSMKNEHTLAAPPHVLYCPTTSHQGQPPAVLERMGEPEQNESIWHASLHAVNARCVPDLQLQAVVPTAVYCCSTCCTI